MVIAYLSTRCGLTAADQQSWVNLESARLAAKIDPLGAQLSVLRDRAGRDLMWGGDPAYWAGRAPLLFPIVGALAGGSYRLGAQSFALPRHGFARVRLFELDSSDSRQAVFRLMADAATRQIYPFEFDLTVGFALNDSALVVTVHIHNHGDVPMPASFGFHPAFRWPLPFGGERASHFLEFPDDEPDSIRRLDGSGLLTPERHPTPVVGRRLALADALFASDAVIFDKIRSRFVTYGAADGPRLRVSFPDTPYLGLWSKPRAEFICIEPWHGVADPQGYDGDFLSKPGIFIVAPGGCRQISMEITLLEP
jgi:galactose mutarotase-like enzyme